jgi:hypothetical protein
MIILRLIIHLWLRNHAQHTIHRRGLSIDATKTTERYRSFPNTRDYVKDFTQTLESFDGINTVCAIDELEAAYAADGYARTRGLGAVSLQYGVSAQCDSRRLCGAQPGSSDQRCTGRNCTNSSVAGNSIFGIGSFTPDTYFCVALKSRE